MKLIPLEQDTAQQTLSNLSTESIISTAVLKERRPSFVQKEETKKLANHAYAGKKAAITKTAEEIIRIIPVDPEIKIDDNYLLNEETALVPISVDENITSTYQYFTKQTTTKDVKKFLEEKRIFTETGKSDVKQIIAHHNESSSE